MDRKGYDYEDLIHVNPFWPVYSCSPDVHLNALCHAEQLGVESCLCCCSNDACELIKNPFVPFGLTHSHPTHGFLHFYIETYLSYFEFKLQIFGKKYLYR